MSDTQTIEQTALRLLRFREHGSAELRLKLLKRGFATDAVETTLSRLAERNLLNDVRFVESYVDERMRKGFGPLRIAAELRERGVDDALIGDHLDPDEGIWMEVLAGAHAKKFGVGAATERLSLARRARFLEYRGFTTAQVSSFLKFDD